MIQSPGPTDPDPTDRRADGHKGLPQALSGRVRLVSVVGGVVPASVGIPLVLVVWAPLWFAVAWVVAYVTVSGVFCGLVYHRSTERLEQTWSTLVAILYAALPASAAYWSVRPQDWWAAVAIVMAYVAFEVSALPFLPINEWRLGVTLVAITVTVSGLFVINPIVAVGFLGAFAAIISAADRLRELKRDLEVHLAEAQRTIRHDPMTGLLNRRGLAWVFEQFAGDEITLALIDVDRFKAINDTHGHHVGDQVLIAVARELRERLGRTASLARLGGDEFVAVLAGAVELDNSLADRVNTSFLLHGRRSPIEVGLSIGVTQGSSANAAQRLLSQAGFAMRESKRQGATLSHFGIDLRDRLDRTLEITALAHGSQDEGELVPVAQAIVQDDCIAGCELLVRWRRPDGTLLLPGQFLPMAVEAGLMSTINEQMLEHAVRFAARFNHRPAAPFVSVNITATHLGDSGFCDRVHRLLLAYRVPPARLMIEITETEQLAGYGRWESAATDLRSLGVQLAIDDFGTGYSSIERLHHLPISHLKFDRTLVRSVSGPFGEIVAGVARFAKAVDIGIIAEGIETLGEYDAMRAFDIDAYQGYLFHRPESLDVVEAQIIEHGRHVARAAGERVA